jgi:dihydropteroate synthase type 2
MSEFIKPKIIGIVNITEDSFSDGGLYLKPRAAIEHAGRLVAEGADIIELGPASSHPDSRQVSADEEIRRLESVMGEIKKLGVAISIDSFQKDTQRYGIQENVAYLNDTAGFAERDFYPELAQSDCSLIIVHSIHEGGMAAKMDYPAEVIMKRVFNRQRQVYS